MKKLLGKIKSAWDKIDWREMREKASVAAASWIIKQMNRRAKQKPPAKTDCQR